MQYTERFHVRVQLTGAPARAVLGRAYAEVLEESFGLERRLDNNFCKEDSAKDHEPKGESESLHAFLQAAVSWCAKSPETHDDNRFFPLPFPTCYHGLFVEVRMEVEEPSPYQEPPKDVVAFAFYGREFLLRRTGDFEVREAVVAFF